MSLSQVTVVETVEFAQCPAFLVNGEIVRHQLDIRVLLQKKVPQLLEVNAQSVCGTTFQVRQQGGGVAIQLCKPVLPRGCQ